MKTPKLLLFVFSACLFTGCFSAKEQKYKLVWEDDFNSEKLNSSIWSVEKNRRGGGNAEMQYYIPENATIEMHPSGVNCLVLNAKRETYEVNEGDVCDGKRPATSARLNTQDKLTFTYGKLEARIHLPKTADGIWPAFWMLGNDLMPNLGCDDAVDATPKEELERLGRVVWPKCGEIDILEMGNEYGIKNGIQDRFFNGACHWGEDFQAGQYIYHGPSTTADYSLQDDFHLWTMIWTPDSIIMYLDLDKYPNTKPYFEMSIAGNGEANHPSKYYHKPFHIVFDLSIGGYFTGIPAPEKYPKVINDDCEQFLKVTGLPSDGTPVKMYIDYIRLYQRGDKGETLSINN